MFLRDFAGQDSGGIFVLIQCNPENTFPAIMNNMWPFSRKKSQSELFQLQPGLFDPTYLEALSAALLASPYLAQNVLNARFASTEGFSVIFQTAQVPRVLQDFPFLQNYLQRLVRPEINLYYLNALALRQNARVERHIDHSIRGYGETLPYPDRVSVLYLTIPAMQGGVLQLYDPAENPLTEIQPQSGLWLHFRGDLKHAISPVSGLPAEAPPRLSLVCEQYRLRPSELEAVPEYVLKSTVGFEQFLAQESKD